MCGIGGCVLDDSGIAIVGNVRSAEPLVLGEPLDVPQRALRKLWRLLEQHALRRPPAPQLDDPGAGHQPYCHA